MKRTGYVLFLVFVLAACGPTLTFSLDEAQINTLAAPYLGDIPGVSGVYVDLIPNGVYVSARVARFGQSVRMGATMPVMVRDGRLRVFATQAWLEGLPAPAWVAQMLNDSVAPRINTVINRAMRPVQFMEIIDVQVTDAEMVVRLAF